MSLIGYSPRAALLSLALLLLPVAGPQAQTALPTPEALAARHDSLVGGRAALEGARSMRMVGTLAVRAMGLEAPLEILKVKPNRYLFRAQLGPMGELLSGFDGEHAWAIQPGMGPTLVTGAEGKLIADQADFFADLHDLLRFDKVETVDQTTFEGRPTYRVRMTRPTGEVLTEYFDAETGLSAGVSASVNGPMGALELVSAFQGYQRFGRVLRPTRTIQRNPQFETLLTISAIEFDGVSDEAVAMPAAVRAMIPPR
ncbi:MAG: hypothetical protein FJ362_01760 [Gemmatimonadetes bacterium]|nr:hypothetical protein [Gemmatimonadota bacterium]